MKQSGFNVAVAAEISYLIGHAGASASTDKQKEVKHFKLWIFKFFVNIMSLKYADVKNSSAKMMPALAFDF